MHEASEIWKEYRSALTGFLRKRVADPDDAEDILQDVLIRTYKSLPDLRDRDNLRAWLFSIARNATTDYYRAKKRDRKVQAQDLWYDDDEPAALQDFETCVHPFLTTLAEEDAALLRAIDLQGQPQKAVAETQGIPYSTLKSRVQKARSELQRKFEQCCSLTLDSQGRVADYERKTGSCERC